MNYWFTTHWPPRVDDSDDGRTTGVWVPEGREQAASDLRKGDYVAVYEAQSGRTEVRKLPNGTTVNVPCQPGRGGMICYGVADSDISADENSQQESYVDGSEIWWRWYAPVSICSRSGFVARANVLRILGYNPNYNFHGFGDYHSGLKKISESQFWLLVKAFHASRPIRLPTPTGSMGSSRKSGEEGPVHLNLKRYVASNPAVALKERGLRTLHLEYKFSTNDRADIVLADRHDRIIGLEIEPSVLGDDVIGLLQAIKYRYMLECVAKRERGDSRGILVSHEISEQVKTACEQYGIEYFEISRNVVDSWVAQNKLQ